MKSGDFVELIPNDIFKERAFEIIMASPKKLMINVSLNKDHHMNTNIDISMVANHITREAWNEMQEEAAPVQRGLAKSLFGSMDF